MAVIIYALLFIPPLVVILVWKYDKRSFYTNSAVLMGGIIMACAAYMMAFPLDWPFHSERGIVGITIGYAVAIGVYAYLLRRYFKLTWLSMAFAALLPLSFAAFYGEIESFLYTKPAVDNSAPQDTGSFTSRGTFRAAELSMEDYKKNCGQYPAKLEDLVVKPSDCPKWEKSAYGTDSVMKDRWGNDFVYSTDRKSHYELKSLGADGREGGTGPNMDQVFKYP